VHRLCKFAQVNWDDLKHLVALRKAGSLSAAARGLGAEHTTVARRIASLEAELGIRLFERSRDGYVLTPEGEPIAEIADRIEEAAFSIERLAHGRQPGLEGVVRISAPPTFASRFLAGQLAPLRSRHPGIAVELVGDSRSVSLSRREADIAIRLARPQGASMVARRIGTMAFGLYGERAYVERTREEAREFIGYDESLDHVPQQQWLRSACGARRLVFRSNELETLHQAVIAGIGMAVLPRFLGDSEARLARVPVEPPPDGRGLWLIVHPDLRRSPRVRAVMDHLVDVTAAAREILDPGDGS
jgi:DNA-binding transcriptional LysR family regulator